MDLLPFGPLSISIKRIRHLIFIVKRREGAEKKKEDDSTFQCVSKAHFSSITFSFIFVSSSQSSAVPAGPDQMGQIKTLRQYLILGIQRR